MKDVEEPPIQTILSWVFWAAVIENEVDCIFCSVWFGLVWFYGISTIGGYLMPNPFTHTY